MYDNNPPYLQHLAKLAKEYRTIEVCMIEAQQYERLFLHTLHYECTRPTLHPTFVEFHNLYKGFELPPGAKPLINRQSLPAAVAYFLYCSSGFQPMRFLDDSWNRKLNVWKINPPENRQTQEYFAARFQCLILHKLINSVCVKDPDFDLLIMQLEEYREHAKSLEHPNGEPDVMEYRKHYYPERQCSPTW